MRILLSNDDGIHAPGLRVLEEMARTLFEDVWIAAPELDQSGASHSLTLKDPLRVRDVGPKHMAINGTPTDCVMLAVCDLMKENRPHLILSGVNYGANLGDDVIYSGTVAAAMEGALLDIPSIAFSLVHDETHMAHWETALHFGPSIIQHLLATKWSSDIVMNVNFPPLPPEKIKGFRVTTQGERPMPNEAFLKRVDPRGRTYYWVGPGPAQHRGDPGTDLEAIAEGYISITPLSFHLTHGPSLAILEETFKSAYKKVG